MDEFVKLLSTTGKRFAEDIRGISPVMAAGNDDCITGNCDGGWGACECNCDCPDDD